MSTLPSEARSRRAVLVGTVGGLAAAMAQALGRPLSTKAATGDPFILGQGNVTDSQTSLVIDNDLFPAVEFRSRGNVLQLQSEGSVSPALDVHGGFSGVQVQASGLGVSASGGFAGLRADGRIGVQAQGGDLFGLDASTNSGIAVRANTGSSTLPAIQARGSGGATAVVAFTGLGPDPVAGTGIGVLAIGPDGGVRAQSTNGVGVSGQSENGVGVFGDGAQVGVSGISRAGAGVRGESIEGSGVPGGSSSYGVVGVSDSGVGVRGASNSFFGVEAVSENYVALRAYGANGGGITAQSIVGTGVASSSDSGNDIVGGTVSGIGVVALGGGTGTAFYADGRVKFTAATLATIPAGASSVTVSPGIDLTADSKVLCTLQSNPGPRTIRFVEVNATADTYTVRLTGNAPTPVRVACFVID